MPPNICDNVKILATTLASDAVPIFFVTKICASFVPKIVAPTRKRRIILPVPELYQVLQVYYLH